ncbi:MAPEG family protein [Aestuariibacter salexigens]|uniref:MAPEG family protein n=1 Tax=Aestuariibacter salexigens TaxID=226010 RepID=UPI00047A100F|nr:MAPEG family protein [Aestuariibacter salexigens]
MPVDLLLQPVFAMAGWTFVMMVWMYATRLPAMMKLKIHPQKGQDTRELAQLLPKEVSRVANNYNHLFEQPTVFYVVCIAIVLMEHTDTVHIYCAWIYVMLRVFHSLVQATIDKVMLRFTLFSLSWLALGVMIMREILSML